MGEYNNLLLTVVSGVHNFPAKSNGNPLHPNPGRD